MPCVVDAHQHFLDLWALADILDGDTALRQRSSAPAAGRDMPFGRRAVLTLPLG